MDINRAEHPAPQSGFAKWIRFIRANQLFGLALMLVSLPFSNFFMSIAGFWLAGTWLAEVITSYATGNKNVLLQKARLFFTWRSATMLTGLYLVLIIGLLWTEDFKYAWHDLRIKLPLLFMPFVMLTMRPVNEKHFRALLVIFIVALAAATMYCLAVLYGLTRHEIKDVREASVFISHIRFSLLLVFGICGLWVVFRNEKKWRWLAFAVALFFIYFLWVIESVTGFGVLLAVCGWFLLHQIFTSHYASVKWGLLLLFAGGSISVAYYLKNCYEDYFNAEKIDWNTLEEFSPGGERYEHRPENTQLENGHYIFTYIAWGELYAEWKKRSNLHPDSADALGHPVKGTLIRYLTSKGLRKDEDGIAQLTPDDVKKIEQGVTNAYQNEKSGLRRRIDKLLFEYDVYRNGGNPSGHSVLQRLEFWHAALAIIDQNFWKGTGTGDIKNAFARQYETMDSRLDDAHRLRAHNQYLTLWATTGICGFLWFLLVLIYPVVFEKRWRDMLFMPFIIIASLSCLAEDTLESQAGVTFFTFLFSFLLSRKPG